MIAHTQAAGGDITLLEDPVEAVRDAGCVVTDAWASMGDEEETRERRLERFLPCQIDAGLMSNAGRDAIFLHCLPAYRGEEVTNEVLDGESSAVPDEAENRLHAQKTILLWCRLDEQRPHGRRGGFAAGLSFEKFRSVPQADGAASGRSRPAGPESAPCLDLQNGAAARNPVPAVPEPGSGQDGNLSGTARNRNPARP